MALLLIALPSGLAVQPAYDLISRNFGPAATAAFQLSIDTTACPVSKLCFSLWQNGTSVAITASSMSELTYGIGYYVRFSCGLTVGWRHGGGSHTHSDQWPCHGSHGSQPLTPLMRERTVPYTYEDNVCTHSYSYVWYDEAEWVAHIDWMALQGVNVFLALTGQEEVQYKAFRKFGLNDTEIREFFNGPAYLTWSRGQDIQSAGASALPEGGTSGLPRSWMQSQWALQKKILRLTRSLGIVGVLPAFQGNMPPGIKRLHPQANISLTNPTQRTWNGTKGECAWVASTDPLFGTVADAWMETLIADFGTDHWYQCDGFFTGAKPPWYERAHDNSSVAWDGAAPVEPDQNWLPVWKAAWGGMARTDPAAKWLYQGWAIRGWNDAAGAARIRALYEAVPHGQWVPLDMDISGIWRYFHNYSFFGAPFIWTTLHNMGGNDGLKGDMRMLQDMPSLALAAGASIVGTGATPEGIDQNPPYYEYTFDSAWSSGARPLDAWFQSYSSRRYGNTANAAAANAWKLLTTAVYNSQAGGWHDDTGVQWNGLPSTVPNARGIDASAVFAAWRLLVQAGAALDPLTYATLNYDIVNAGREVLAQLITVVEHNLTSAVTAVDKPAALVHATTLQAAYADLDELLGCDNGFLLGAWIANARKWANSSDAPASYYEWQARSQVSTWWPVAPSARQHNETFARLPILDNYANKHWNGLVRDFYARRVQCYIDQVSVDLPASRPTPANCTIGAERRGVYLHNYPPSLPGSDGTHTPATWPYDTGSLPAAKAWCCAHADCGGVTHQNGRFEVRAGSQPMHNPAGSTPASSYVKAHSGALNAANLTRCVVTKELDFTQDTRTTYPAVATTSKTLELSTALIDKYARYFSALV